MILTNNDAAPPLHLLYLFDVDVHGIVIHQCPKAILGVDLGRWEKLIFADFFFAILLIQYTYIDN
jgi:hypothetical protein